MKLRYTVSAAIVGTALALAAAPASAQMSTREHGFAIGFGGATSTVVTSPFYGAAAGANITRHVQIVGEVGRMENVFATFTRDDLQIFRQGMADEGVSLATEFNMPILYTTGAVRVLIPTGTRARPFVSMGGGIAWLRPEPTFKVQGIDVTDAVMTEPVFAKAFEKQTRPIATAGAGVAVEVVKHFTVQLGYRYSRVFVDKNYLQDIDSPHAHNGINLHRGYAGMGFAF
jgi:opacity protein-like surface antigen